MDIRGVEEGFYARRGRPFWAQALVLSCGVPDDLGAIVASAHARRHSPNRSATPAQA
jgi:hypothetical protein